MTEYVILGSWGEVAEEPKIVWQEIGRVKARSARDAIRERVDGAAQTSEFIGEGTYAAVPARSWRPVTVKVETKTALKFS